MSDDEEIGLEPAFEYNNKSISNTESSKENINGKEEDNAKREESPDVQVLENDAVEAGNITFEVRFVYLCCYTILRVISWPQLT